MHASISSYLSSLADKGCSPLTIKAARFDLTGFAEWWESRYGRPFNPALLRTSDLPTWRLTRQKDDATASATINRALVTLRAYCNWAQRQRLISENPPDEIKAVPTSQPFPKSLPAEAVDAILRAVRDEALLALLIYTGLRAQETCNVQICCSPASTSGWWSSVRMRRRCDSARMLRRSQRRSGSVR